MRQNRILAKLRAGEPTFGLWLTIGSPILAEDAAQAGFDWVALDLQHGYWSHDEALTAIQIISHTESVPVVRLAINDASVIGRYLDNGALGVIVPLVNSVAEAQRAATAARYPPQGVRSAGGSRLLGYGPDYFSAANPEIFLAVMLETAQAATQAESILSVPGVDCGFIGPTDLGLDLAALGYPSDHVEQTIQDILAAGQRCGVPVGIPCGSAARASQRAAQGFQFMDVGSDVGFFWAGIREAKQTLAAGPPA